MDYEQKYKDALPYIKDLIEHNVISKESAGKYFPEIKESEDEKSKNWVLEYLYDGLRKSDEQFKGQFNAAIAWLEKQGEQKPADKVEPKFKVGDWVVQENIGIYKIIEICESWYEVIDFEDNHFSISFDNEYMCHIWSIQDAKDGDVLTCYSDYKGQPIEQTGIIKQYVGKHGGCSNCFKAHFGVDWDNNVVIEEYMGSPNIYPATKEQRDLLFQKMKESGYEWDAEKKDLKIIDWSKYIKYEPNGPSIVESKEDSDWIDLGLPSGTLWKSSNETNSNNNFYKYDEAMRKFGEQLPTKEQWAELKGNCRWTWTGNGYNVKGYNGKFIFLPAAGYSDSDGNEYDVGSAGDYWSSTPNSSTFAYSFDFDWLEIVMYSVMRSYRQSVRLVK